MAVTYETDVTGMETTQYYKLYKPGYDNVADVNVLNINADLIDAILHDHESLIDDIQDRTVDGIKIDKNTNVTNLSNFTFKIAYPYDLSENVGVLFFMPFLPNFLRIS